MQSIPIVIVGAGPAGLVLALCLAQFHIKSLILEKEQQIVDDPRGVYLAGDALRVLWKLGLGDRMPLIGEEVEEVCFHKGSFKAPPMFRMDTSGDLLNHAIPTGLLQNQPKLERMLRDVVDKSTHCTLQSGCEVVELKEPENDDDMMKVTYIDNEGTKNEIQTRWLIGADGKRGIVRKQFLEPTAGIKQQDGIIPYEGNWIAANLKLSLPTPETHPDFLLWKLGFAPQEAYDLFWPKGWHFCSPPSRATATGRFGPHSERLWRHEFHLTQAEYDDNSSGLEERLLWEHLTPMITRSQDAGRRFGENVTYPRDCIKVLRCEKYQFKHKVVDRWFHKRVILIGDAAHVFPPFGGQGIACGIRDAESLAWRLAVLMRVSSTKSASNRFCDEMLSSWARERRLGVDNSMRFTTMNGQMCNNNMSTMSGWLRYVAIRGVLFWGSLAASGTSANPIVRIDSLGYSHAKSGFFLPEHGGGIKVAQTYAVAEIQSEKSSTESEKQLYLILSDKVLHCVPTMFSLLVLGQVDRSQLHGLLARVQFNSNILSEQSLVDLHERASSPRAKVHIFVKEEEFLRASSSAFSSKSSMPAPTWFPAEEGDVAVTGKLATRGYESKLFFNQIKSASKSSPKFAIIRPDSIIYAVAKDMDQLESCLRSLKAHIS